MKAHVVVLVTWGMAGSLLAPGCSTYRDPATGAEAHYGLETLRARLDLDVGTVYAAAREATDVLNLKVLRAAEDGISGEIWALDAQYDQVYIRLGAMPESRTRLAINIGVFGDKYKSLVLFEHIMQNVSQAEPLGAEPVVQWGGPVVGPPRGRER